MKTWDVIVVGGGIIGLSLAIQLRKRGVRVLIVERGEPGREASHAAAGMLADSPAETPPALLELAQASARMYPEFVHELQDESGIRVDLREHGTIVLSSEPEGAGGLTSSLLELEPALANTGRRAYYRNERCLDPRALVAAAIKAAKHRLVDISSGAPVVEIMLSEDRAAGVRTDKTAYLAPVIVNCAGAWAGHLPPYSFPTRPVKGQILAVVGGPALRHVVRAPEVYLVPRSDGRIVIGATSEEAGYDKRTEPATIQRLYHAAMTLAPGLGQARIHEAWAGLRPGTPDGLPILGESAARGYFVAAGHFRDGVLLAPITAQVMADLITEGDAGQDISAFSAARFASEESPLQRAV